MSCTADSASRSTSRLVQDIRLAYENRDREGLERLLKKVGHIESVMASGQALFSPVDRCTCQHGPQWRVLVGSPGEPALCADCRKPITIIAGNPQHTAAVGIPLDMGGVTISSCTCGDGTPRAQHAAWCGVQMNRFPPFS